MIDMTTKRVLTIKDENYGETFVVSSKSGIFMHDNIIIIDTKELAQLCCERATFCDKNNDNCICHRNTLNDIIFVKSRDIFKKIKEDTTGIAFDNINDNEEIEWK